MKKLILCGVIAASLGITAAQAAGSASQQFDVTAQLTAKCASTDASKPQLDFGAYPAFGSATNASPTADIHFQCTHGVTITSTALSNANSTVAGLAYSLTVAKTGGGAGAAASGPTGNTLATGAGADTYVYTITGAMPSGQAGDAAASATDTQTLTINF